MPNHIVNEVIFESLGAAQRDRILARVVNLDTGRIDFALLLPVPLNAWWGGVNSKHEKAFGLTAIDWCTANWGTKWNAYSQATIEPEDGRLRLVFQTAWAPPYGWLAALLNTFNLPFRHNWLDEGSDRGRVGVFEPHSKRFGGGKEWDEVDADDTMNMHLHVLRWGTSAEEIMRERAAGE